MYKSRSLKDKYNFASGKRIVCPVWPCDFSTGAGTGSFHQSAIETLKRMLFAKFDLWQTDLQCKSRLTRPYPDASYLLISSSLNVVSISVITNRNLFIGSIHCNIDTRRSCIQHKQSIRSMLYICRLYQLL